MSPLARVRAQLEAFLKTEAASGVVLLLTAVVALALANSDMSAAFARFWAFPLRLEAGGLAFGRSLEWWVNDGLMVLFFYVVGLEIRREIEAGELSDLRRAAVPFAAALGGLTLPAVLYLSFADQPATRAGWGVPMATDIAFAVGILTLLGRRVPPALRVLLLTLAVIDDVGAILVIAVFYSSGLSPVGLLVALAGFGAVLLLQRLRVRDKIAYVLPSLVTWAGVYAAGAHPTIAGVALGLVTPVTAWPRSGEPAAEVGPAPADQLLHALHPWVAFAVMPIFALANAGVSLAGFTLHATTGNVLKGVILGLVVGKPLGIALATWLVLRLGLGELPRGLGARHVAVVGVVAGVGFTMSLFVAQLAFEEGPLLSAAKLAVLVASSVSGVLALVLGRLVLRPVATPEGGV